MDGRGVRMDSEKRAKGCSGDDGWTSQLPDDIIAAIFCLLPMKEAVRTCILSSQWTNVWKHIRSLEFDDDRALDRIAKHLRSPDRFVEQRKLERGMFVERVNHIVQSHKSPTLKEFRVCFDLCKSSEKEITQWVEYAFARKVERFELDFSEHEDFHDNSLNYAFPEDFLTQRSILDFTFLKAFSLKGVNVTGEAVEFFLRNCPLLEELIINTTRTISNLEVCGSSLMLKHLEICYVDGLKSLKISAPKLTSLNVTILKGLLLDNVPMLVDVSLIFRYLDDNVEELVRAFSCCISQLEILRLTVNIGVGLYTLRWIPELPKLKKLDIKYWPSSREESLIGLTLLIRGCPYLQEFVLRSVRSRFSKSNGEAEDFVVKSPHHHLKVVTFGGYHGYTCDVELIRYLLETCVVLEKIIVDPRFQLHCREPPWSSELECERIARNNAQQLEAEVPKHIELVVL